MLPREKLVDSGLDTGIDKALEDLEGDTQQIDGSRLVSLKDFDNYSSFPDLGGLEVAQAGREEFTLSRLLFSAAWSINCEIMEFGSGAFPGFRCWKTDVSSSMMKSPERL